MAPANPSLPHDPARFPDSIPARLLLRAQQAPEEPGYAIREDSGWKRVGFAAYAAEVVAAARGLLHLGVTPGDRICILGENRPEWVILDVAAMMVGAVPAGIYVTCSAEEVAYILDHSESVVVLVEDAGQLEKVLEHRARLPALRAIVAMRGGPKGAGVLAWEELLSQGSRIPMVEVEGRLAAIKPSDPATFIYTSGTTGPPKAVMLSHDNLCFTANIALSLVSMGKEDCVLSYLPLSHIAEQMFSIHAPISAGGTVYYGRGRDHLQADLAEVQPTVFFGVPRVWEKFAAGIQAKLGEATGVKARLAAWAMRVGAAANDLKNRGEALPLSLKLQYRLASKLVFSKLKPRVGLGRARICVSGAAPVSAEVLKLLASLDIVVHEVYGQSEDCGPTSFNPPGGTRFGTVGPAMPGVEVRIAEDGEILVRGRNVFLGYFKDPVTTAATLQDGWLHSGDLGRFDEQGFLSITGRKKDIIITSGGKNITPANIESALRDLPLVSQAVVVGDRRNYIAALLTLDPDAVARFRAGQPGGGMGEPSLDPQVRAEIQRGVDAVNQRFARVEHVRRFVILPRDLLQSEDELTPTLKVKRAVVVRNWASTIDSMYAEGEA
jgi:long-chain acyl-CoA synthetase